MSKDAWKTGCMRHVVGIWRRYVSGDKAFSIKKGPSLLGDIFLDLLGTLRLVASSHTLSPTLNGENFRDMCRVICILANSCAASASLLVSFIMRSLCDSVGVSV